MQISSVQVVKWGRVLSLHYKANHARVPGSLPKQFKGTSEDITLKGEMLTGAWLSYSDAVTLNRSKRSLCM